ncbi:unnamed protein product [Paramecium octaurelia]|uniref:Uncharacterized protein n=1 Tax=Paramecium octaurelia TaxID=43137 RepID=A0A8S1YP91_PAROT|nr:unnamed protein product [Paramecium octaurelia]
MHCQEVVYIQSPVLTQKLSKKQESLLKIWSLRNNNLYRLIQVYNISTPITQFNVYKVYFSAFRTKNLFQMLQVQKQVYLSCLFSAQEFAVKFASPQTDCIAKQLEFEFTKLKPSKGIYYNKYQSLVQVFPFDEKYHLISKHMNFSKEMAEMYEEFQRNDQENLANSVSVE